MMLRVTHTITGWLQLAATTSNKAAFIADDVIVKKNREVNNIFVGVVLM